MSTQSSVNVEKTQAQEFQKGYFYTKDVDCTFERHTKAIGVSVPRIDKESLGDWSEEKRPHADLKGG